MGWKDRTVRGSSHVRILIKFIRETCLLSGLHRRGTLGLGGVGRQESPAARERMADLMWSTAAGLNPGETIACCRTSRTLDHKGGPVVVE